MAETQALKTNIPEFSVSDLAFSLKRTLEDTYGHVRVRGELSRVSIAASGHMYSSLKDDDAVIDAVCWKGTMAKLGIQPEEGLEVICTGRISTYPARSNYQLIIESMELAGEGALLKMLEERRKKLAEEGLFDEGRKKEIPFLPEIIGVVTSPTGAVIRDILHRLSDRFPRQVLVWPVLVQGDGAAEQVSKAINGFQNIHEQGLPKPDLLIVARGGGSLEDLMPFNEENVVRAVAASDIPVISAVGHETDTTLIDYVADLRAPTPTGAAEKAVPVRAELLAQMSDVESRLLSASNRLLSENRHRLQTAEAKLGDPSKLLEVHTQKLDHLGDKMGHVFSSFVSVKKQKLIEAAAQIRDPKNLLRESEQNLQRWSEQLQVIGPKLFQNFEKQLEHAGKMLEAYSFENVLQRGFAVVQTPDGQIISEAAQTEQGQAVHLRFKDQQMVDATIGQNKLAPAKKPKRKTKKKADDNQGQLF